MGRSTAYETDKRTHRVADLLAKGASARHIVQFAAENWNLRERQARTLIQRARALLKEDFDIERPDFLATRLATLDIAIQRAMSTNNMNALVGAVRLQSELARLVK